MAQLTAGQTLTASLLNQKLRKCVARARRTTNSTSTTSTTSVGVLRLDDIPLKAGVTYRITYKLTGDTVTSTDTLRGLIRYTTDTTTPTTSSTLLVGTGGECVFTSGSSGSTLVVTTDYVPVTDEYLSLLLCIQHTLGTSAIIAQADGGIFLTEMYVDDMGDDPGNTGTSV